MALARLADAYARLGLDQAAYGSERIFVWAAWRGSLELLSQSELDALGAVRHEAARRRGNGADCMEHIALKPARQVELLRAWHHSALHWNALALRQQREQELLRAGKELVNACCLRRHRDIWKRYSTDYLHALALCVRLAERHAAELWCGDLNHRIFFQLVLAAPRRLAPLLARLLPHLHQVSPALRDIYERAVVCLLRSRHRGALSLLESKVLGRAIDDYSYTERRLLGHLVRLASPGAAHVIAALAALPQAQLQRMLRKTSGARLLKDCLLQLHRGDLALHQARLAARLLDCLELSAHAGPARRERYAEIENLARAALQPPRPPLRARPRPDVLERTRGLRTGVPDAETTGPAACQPEPRAGDVLCSAPVMLWCHCAAQGADTFCFYTPKHLRPGK